MDAVNTTTPEAVILPPSVTADDTLKPSETLFCGRMIARIGNSPSVTLTNEQLAAITRRSPINASLMLTKLQAQGHLQLTYAHLGRRIGCKRTIGLSAATLRSLKQTFGPDWACLVQPATKSA